MRGVSEVVFWRFHVEVSDWRYLESRGERLAAQQRNSQVEHEVSEGDPQTNGAIGDNLRERRVVVLLKIVLYTLFTH